MVLTEEILIHVAKKNKVMWLLHITKRSRSGEGLVLMLLMMLFLFVEKHAIQMDIRGQYLVDTSNWVDHQFSGHAGIDQFFVIDDHRVRIIDTKGKIIHDFNKKGQGPGEMVYPSAVIWDGFHYWVNASMEHRLHLFDEDFLWLDHLPIGYIAIHPFGKDRSIVGQLIEPVFSTPNLLGPHFVDINYDGQEMSEGKRFGKYQPIMKEYEFFLSLVFVWSGQQNQVHVAHSYDGNVQIYNEDGKFVEHRAYGLRGFEKVDEEIPDFRNINPNVYMKDKSYIVKAGGEGNKAVFIYTLPSQNYNFEMALYQGEEGKFMPLQNRIFMGIHNDKIYFLKEESTDQDYFYFIETWDWSELWQKGF